MPPVHKLPTSPETATPVLLQAAESLGLAATINDPAAGLFEFRTEVGAGGKAARVTVSLTDDGFDATALHIAVDPAGSWSGKRAARRLVRETRRECENAG